MPRPVVYLVYNLLLPVFLVIGLPSFLIKGLRRGGLARNFRQRFGIFSSETLARFRGKKPVWIHAVSVGEIFLALKIIDAIRQAKPGQHIVLSTTTTTGYRVAAEKESDTLTVIHNPVDLPFVTARVIRLIDPSRLVLIEAEIWPNLVAQLKRRGTPVVLINARLSPRSERRYLQVKGLIAPVFSLLDGVTVPFDVDQDRWAGLGIPRERILVTGSVKFDNAGGGSAASELQHSLAQWLTDTGMPEVRRLLLAGSTHDGEEKLIALVADRLRIEVPDLALVIVPRHAERGGAIAAQLRGLGFDPVLRVEPNRVESDTKEGQVGPAKDRGRVWIANTTGELRSWFHLAELVVIGKSFCSEGGQNPVEPILCGMPVVVGPHMENFSDVVADLLAVEGICQVAGEEALPTALLTLLRNPGLGLEMARSGAAAMARHEGAAERNATFLLAAKAVD
jgi:3-deoxy-D-manno-octulosonic-acid transferase